MDCSKFGSYETIKVVGLCLPVSESIQENIDLGLSFFEESLSDVKNTWQISLTVLFLSLVTSLLVMFFIKVCGSCLVFSIIVLYFIILITFGVLCYE